MLRTFAIVAGLVAGVAAAPVLGAVSNQQKCENAKITARGKWRACRATERGKVVLGKVADYAKCDTKLAKAMGKAEAAVGPCRYVDNGDGTVSDIETGLMWEKKSNVDLVAHPEDPNDGDNTYSFGGAEGEFIPRMNGTWRVSGNPLPGPETPPYAGYADWRLPAWFELQPLVDTTVLVPFVGTPCGEAPIYGACIDPIFGPTRACASQFDCPYWTSSANFSDTPGSWAVNFLNGSVLLGAAASWPVRAVRAGDF
jgi:hypothetical protein